MKRYSLLLFFFFLTVFTGVSLMAQVNASFTPSATTGCIPLTVNFTNNSTTGANITYYWDFGNGQTSTAMNPSTVFAAANDYTVLLIVTNTSTSESDQALVTISPSETPSANFTPVDASLCANEYFVFNYNSESVNSAIWVFGDGKTDTRTINPMTHAYSADGTYNVKLQVYNNACGDTFATNVTVVGPKADFNMSKEHVCVGETVTYTLGANSGVTSYSWDFGDGNLGSGSSVQHTYSLFGNYIPTLRVTGPTGNCEIKDTLEVFHVEAIIEVSGESFCEQRIANIQNSSFGNDINHWDLGNGQTSNLKNPVAVFDVGQYTLTLSIANNYGCRDTTEATITVKNAPDIQLGQGWYVCRGDSVTLEASGGHRISWSPGFGLSSTTSYTPRAAPPYSMNYLATIYDTVTNCNSTGYILVTVQEEPDWDELFSQLSNVDTIMIGDEHHFQIDSLESYSYTWSPEYNISCINCASPVIQPLTSTVYSLFIVDTNNCFSHEYEIPIVVREEFSVGLPDAFKPGSAEEDGDNLLFVKGWGIKNLIEFRIYNRWGVEVFFTDDINTGWDGKYKGKIQNMDTYMYYFKAEMWNGQIQEKRGSVNLLK